MHQNDEELDKIDKEYIEKYSPKELKKEGLMARESKYNSWVSRDWKEINCKAIGCKYNREEFCMTPSRAKFDEQAKCSGFEARLDKGKIDGD